MTEPQSEEKTLLSEKLGALTDVALREYGLEATRLLFQHTQREQLTVSLKHWTRKLFPLVLPGLKEESAVPNEITYQRLDQVAIVVGTDWDVRVYVMRIHQFWKWMELAGFAIPFGKDFWAITPLGKERLKSEHPCSPGALDRLRTEFGGDFQDAVDRLEDAHECFDRGLWRPTVMLLGLSYEELLMKMANKLGVTGQNALARMTALRTEIDSHKKKGKTTDSIEAILSALNVADIIRERRNKVSHVASTLLDATEVDQLLTDGTRCFGRIAGYKP